MRLQTTMIPSYVAEGEHVMRKVVNFCVLVMVAGPALVLGQAGDVNKVLADMRAALGGDKVAAVKTLTAVGRTQRTSQTGTTSESEMELAMELPDKFVVRSVLANLGNMSVYRNAGFNGTGAINETETPPNLNGSGGMVMFRSAGSGAPGQTQTPEQRAEQDARLVLASKKDFARMTLGMFGSSYAAFPLEFTYAGQAEAGDGKAHVIQVKGPEGFDAKLFVDTRTNLPLMLSWSDREPLQMTTISRGGGPGGATSVGPGQTVQMGGSSFTAGGRSGQPPSEEELKKMMTEAAARQKEAEANAKIVEYRMYYSNFKPVNGVNLPHTLQRSIDGKPTEETSFDAIKVNPKIDSKKFTVTK
jgi:hypothetical protein